MGLEEYSHVCSLFELEKVMKKIGFITLGILLTGFGIAQVLQLLGLIGTKTFSIPGVAFSILGLTLGIACFQKARREN